MLLDVAPTKAMSEQLSLFVKLRRTFSTIVVLFALAHGAHHLVTALPVPLLPFIRNEFGLDYAQAALVVSAFSVPYGIAQLPSGWLADRIGPRLLLLLGTSGLAAVAMLVGVSTQYYVLLVLLVVMGLLGGGYHPSAPSVIVSTVEPSRRGSAIGLHMLGGSIVHFVAPLAAAAVATSLGWRSSFFALAIPSVAFGVVFYVVLGRWGLNRVARSSSPGGIEDVPAARADWRTVVAVIAMASVGTAIILGTASFCPLFLVDVHGYPEQHAGAAMSLLYSGGLWAAILGGHISDRIGRLRVIVAVALLSGPLLMMLGSGMGHVGVLATIVLLGGAFYGASPATEVYVMANTPTSRRSTVLGLYYFGAMEGSGILAPLIGFLIDRLGFTSAFLASGAMMTAVAGVCTILIWRWRREHLAEC